MPAFFYIPSYREMGAGGAPGFFLGILCGAILLTWLYNSTGGSILMVGIWHALFNFFTASAAVSDTLQVVFSVEVMVLSVALVILERPANLATRPRHAEPA